MPNSQTAYRAGYERREWTRSDRESRRFNGDWKALVRHVQHRTSECLRQQRLDQPFRFLIPALTNPHMENHTLFVDEILRRPVTIALAIPRREVVVDGDGEVDVVFLNILLHLHKIMFIRKLW